MQDIARAVPAFSRETLVLLGFEDASRYLDEAIQRHGTLMRLVEGTKVPVLRSMGATVDGMYLHKRGKPEQGNKRFAEAIRLARESGLPEREAAALAAQALVNGADGLDAALRAIALRLRRPDHAPELHPLVVGERGDDAPSIALRSLLAREDPDEALALRLIELIKTDRMGLALRGRDAILVRTLDEKDYRSYIDRRGALREARAAAAGVDQAEKAFLAEIERLRPLAPLAFGTVPTLKDVQAVLREDEVLLLFVDDPYVRAVLAVDRSGAELSEFDPEKPLESIAARLENKRRLLVAPDRSFSIDAARWKDDVVSTAFDLYYCAGATSVIAQRKRAGAENRIVAREVESRVRIGLQHPQSSDADLSATERARVVIYAKTVAIPATDATADGIACIAETRIRAGADFVLISFLGDADVRIVARFRQHLEKDGKSAPEALALTRKWARSRKALSDPRVWATLALWGAP